MPLLNSGNKMLYLSLEAGGVIPCRPNPAATLLVIRAWYDTQDVGVCMPSNVRNYIHLEDIPTKLAAVSLPVREITACVDL